MSDPAKYRSKEEVSKMRHERDPIEYIKAIILKNNLASEDKLKEIDKEIRQKISLSADIAQDSPDPDISSLTTDVLV